MATLDASLIGGWTISFREEEGSPIYELGNIDPTYGYFIFDGSPFLSRYKAIFQYNTALPSGAIIDAATITRTRNDATFSIDMYYYAGTWAATPPVADEPTYNGGALAASEASNTIQTDDIELDVSLINSTGTTSVMIYTSAPSSETLNPAPTLSITYHLPVVPHCFDFGVMLGE